MKIVRLKAAELRRWRQNTSYLVDDAGMLVCEVPAALEQALSNLTRTARSQRKSLEQTVAIGGRHFAISIVITRTGIDSADFSVEPNVDGHRVITGRQVMAAEMLQEHGECQLRAPNGVILKVVRDPAAHRPSFAESQQIAPRPEHCPCKTWGRPHPGTHYSTCPWNRLAPPDERAPSNAIDEEEARGLPTEALSGLRRRPVTSNNPATSPIAAAVSRTAVVTQSAPLDPPESCRNDCRSWATPKGFPIPDGQHHPTCAFARAWAIKTARETPRWLVELSTGERVRLATNEEVGQAEVTAQKTGSPIIHIDDVPYAVILQTELDAEERENAAHAATLPAPDPLIARHPAKPGGVIFPDETRAPPAPEP